MAAGLADLPVVTETGGDGEQVRADTSAVAGKGARPGPAGERLHRVRAPAGSTAPPRPGAGPPHATTSPAATGASYSWASATYLTAKLPTRSPRRSTSTPARRSESLWPGSHAPVGIGVQMVQAAICELRPGQLDETSRRWRPAVRSRSAAMQALLRGRRCAAQGSRTTAPPPAPWRARASASAALASG